MPPKPKPPSRMTVINGSIYEPAVLLVTERDHLGRPLTARFVHKEQSVDLRELTADGAIPEFVIVYANHNTWGAPEKEG